MFQELIPESNSFIDFYIQILTDSQLVISVSNSILNNFKQDLYPFELIELYHYQTNFKKNPVNKLLSYKLTDSIYNIVKRIIIEDYNKKDEIMISKLPSVEEIISDKKQFSLLEALSNALYLFRAEELNSNFDEDEVIRYTEFIISRIKNIGGENELSELTAEYKDINFRKNYKRSWYSSDYDAGKTMVCENITKFQNLVEILFRVQAEKIRNWVYNSFLGKFDNKEVKQVIGQFLASYSEFKKSCRLDLDWLEDWHRNRKAA